jgi:uncharacterized membrane protein YkoI
MRREIVLLAALAATVLLASPSIAAEKRGGEKPWTGTIPVTGKHSVASLAKMARVSMADAEKTALSAVEAKDADKSVSSREIEVEHGFLVYSFDVKVAGQKGIEEVIVDAGDGKVLAREHESPESEAREKRAKKP